MRFLLALLVLNGVSFILWGSVGACRFVSARWQRWRQRRRRRLRGRSAPGWLTKRDVAVLVCARNEEENLPICLAAASRIVAADQIFVGSDGSTDDTVSIAERFGVNVLDIQPNRGKASALATVIDHFEICDRFEVVLIADADAHPAEDYLDHALPLFDDLDVAAVAGHAIPKWRAHRLPRWSMFFAAYRTRLYLITQAVLRFGQTTRYTNVNFIVPGFSSMYRCSALREIDVGAPGLSVEDFNMTFELHKKRLGRIAYCPKVCSISQEAYSLRDYYKQVRRWYLGFWQTVGRHGIWFGMFWLSLGVFVVEMLVQSTVFLTVPVVMGLFVVGHGEPVTMWLPRMGNVDLTLVDVGVGVFLVDYGLTAVAAAICRKPMLTIYGLGFFFLRWIDALLYLVTLPLALFSRSDGRWVSPTRI